MMSQSLALAKKPHIIIGTSYKFSYTKKVLTNDFSATPGRLVDHLENTKGFTLKSLKYLVEILNLI